MSDPITPLTPAQYAEVKNSADHEGYVHEVLVQVDILANDIMGGLPDETISSRVADWDEHRTGIVHEIGKTVCEGLDLIQADHGALAQAADEERGLRVAKKEEATGAFPSK